ncbi:DUF7287 family protein [Haloarcula sediminis]|uniref:DUF7287 family protein n=1 Tax=Haloarcula sediminis TaxID=3111777 RepID=UPI002D773EE0|nr:hypothetical protein [Haloarcula sp. CK38]
MGTQSRSEPRISPRAGPVDTRGQTTIDFAIGISVFLAVLLFIFLFIPGILSPFTASAQAETVSSNRAADQLATGMLGSPSDPYALDSYCTVTFFEGDTTGCSFSDDSLEAQLGVATSDQKVNVSLRGDSREILGWNATEPDTGVANSSRSDIVFARGDSLPDTEPSVTSVRVVTLDGRDVTLYVEMW